MPSGISVRLLCSPWLSAITAGSQPRQRCEAALTLAARCDPSCVMLRHHAPDKAGEFSGDRCFCNINLFQGKTVVIPHPNEFLDLLILMRGNMHRTVIMVCKASGDHGCVALICFDSLFPTGTGILVGARITHFTLCAVNSWYSVKPRAPAS